MGLVMSQFTMSLDGFVAGPNDEVDKLFGWYAAGDTPFTAAGTDRPFKISRASADLLTENWGQVGATVTGRRDFDVSNAWGGKPIFGVPTFIVTHSVPREWAYEGSPFTFVTNGVESALAQAQQAAGDKVVDVGGTRIVQQCLQAGLLDGIQIDLVPVLLGDGIRLFDRLGPKPIELEITPVVEGKGVTHIRYRVVK